MRTYDHVLAAVASTPWALEPARGREYAAILTRRVNGERATEQELAVAAAIRAERNLRKSKARPSSIALVALHGVMTQRADIFDQMSGMCSTLELERQIDEAASDPSIEAIVMDVDSPGGSVYGVEQLALKVRAAAEKKKVTAVVNSLAASGAYWVASNASELVVAPDGEVGSVGVYIMHREMSRALDAAGTKVTYIKAGKNKTAGNPHEPLTIDSAAELQKSVDDYYDLFVRAVARGRNATLTKVREGFGQGGTVRAKEAVAEGMADRIGTLDDVLGKYGLSVADVLPAAQSPADVIYASNSDRSAVEIRRRRMQMD